jgi:general secretion pathway protein D
VSLLTFSPSPLLARLAPRVVSAVLIAALAAAPAAWAQDKGKSPKKPAEPASDEAPDDGPAPPPPPERIRPGPGGLPIPKPVSGSDAPPEQGGGAAPATGQEAKESGAKPAASNPPGTASSQKVPCVSPTTKVTIDFADAPLSDVTKYMAEITCRNFILGEELKGTITIISHAQVTVGEAYEAYLSALEVAGYTTVTVGKSTKIVQTAKAANAPLRVYEGDDIPGTDNFVTQIVPLDNVSVTEISTIVKELSGPNAKVIAYAPTNTLMITDAAYNIRRVYRIVKQLDVAAPKSKLEVVPIRFATAADVEKILEEVYGVAATASASASSAGAGAGGGAAARRRRREGAEEAPAAPSATSTNVGTEGAFISKIIADERTNSLILLANEEALAKVKELIARIDIDIDPASRSQIHVIYLEHADATEVASVLQSLSGSSGGGSRSSGSGSSRTGTGGRNAPGGARGGAGGAGGGGARPQGGGPPGFPGGATGTEGGPPGGGSGSVVAAFDSGVRIAADENTNSLVLIAAPEDFRILRGVIDRLDIPRRQVFVEAVVMEVGSEDEFSTSIGYHGGAGTAEGQLGFGAAGLGTSTLTGPLLTADLLSGLAMGVFGQAINVTLADGTALAVPAFGVALNALQSNSGVNILSNPNLLVLDNEEATINVGRNVPFPVSSGRDNNGQPIISYSREDVGITLEVTPQINESNYVTLELSLEVAEVEEDSSGLDVTTAGFITSKRQTQNVVVVRDNQTIVIGGLIGNTTTQVETKVPILGDLPLIGVLFRGKRDTERKTNLLIFITPHVINEPADLEEVYRIKMAQQQEFLRRFYGKSRDAQQSEMRGLLFGSMNFVDQPSAYREKAAPADKAPDPIGPGDAYTPITDPAAPAPAKAPEAAPAPAPEP